MRKLQDMPWYMMSKKSQLAYAHLLYRLQNGAVFRMGPFDPLNFESLSNVSISITFLKTFVIIREYFKFHKISIFSDDQTHLYIPHDAT